MLCTLPHPCILMQNMLQMSPGQSRVMIFSREFNVWMSCNPFASSFPLNIFLKFEAFTLPDMQIVQMRTGQDTLLVDQPSSAMSE